MGAEPNTHPIVDEEVVARLRALRDQVGRPGDDVLGDLLALFVRDSATRIGAMRKAMAANDVKACQRAAHALKGSSSNVGASRVAALAHQMEHRPVSSGDIDRLEAALAEATDLLRQRLA